MATHERGPSSGIAQVHPTACIPPRPYPPTRSFPCTPPAPPPTRTRPRPCRWMPEWACPRRCSGIAHAPPPTRISPRPCPPTRSFRVRLPLLLRHAPVSWLLMKVVGAGAPELLLEDLVVVVGGEVAQHPTRLLLHTRDPPVRPHPLHHLLDAGRAPCMRWAGWRRHRRQQRMADARNMKGEEIGQGYFSQGMACSSALYHLGSASMPRHVRGNT